MTIQLMTLFVMEILYAEGENINRTDLMNLSKSEFRQTHISPSGSGSSMNQMFKPPSFMRSKQLKFEPVDF